jgi:hypothetical protein
VAGPDSRRRSVTPSATTSRTTRHRRVTYSPTATSRFRECFPTGTDVERTGPPTVVDVPSSARPAAPEIRYVVAALQWERTRGAGSTTSLRRGGLLRILLERPWFSSGDGELFGVALWSGDVEPTDEERKGTYFSQWGLDPIWSTRPDANKVLKVDQFPDHASDAQGLTLPDGNVVDVAGFPVHHDEDRDLWFADVRVELPQTYAPFVRLALCRYQPCALPDSELSKTTLADVAQLLPERSDTILVDPADARRHQLVVAGIGPSGPERNEVSVKVQQRDPVVTANLGWNDAPGAADVIQDAVGSAPDTLLWSGTVVCHAPGDQVRVVVREDELLPADPICVWLPPEGSGNLRALIDARLAEVQEGRLAPERHAGAPGLAAEGRLAAGGADAGAGKRDVALGEGNAARGAEVPAAAARVAAEARVAVAGQVRGSRRSRRTRRPAIPIPGPDSRRCPRASRPPAPERWC